MCVYFRMEIEDQITEDNSNLNNSQTWIRKNTRKTTVEIDADLWRLAKQNLIQFKQAMEFGIQFLHAEVTQKACHPRTSLHDKIGKLIQKLEAKSQECEGLRMQNKINEKEDQEDLEKEIDEILNAEVSKDD